MTASGVAPSRVAVEVLRESPLWGTEPDAEAVVRRAIEHAAAATRGSKPAAEVAVLLCDDATIAALNAQWRGREEPTNVLSFPASPASGPATPVHLGDIAIARETVVREAREQARTVSSHLTHLAVHGFLHLLGYDHQTDDEAHRMEALERDILAALGFADPYPDA
ncbi:MAG: rRNA maturation RNase YbeY [Xanthobacteraceae bacterium]|nr:rRNA maturation RNase YbeY [Xanthobacteraceae bacterium]